MRNEDSSVGNEGESKEWTESERSPSRHERSFMTLSPCKGFLKGASEGISLSQLLTRHSSTQTHACPSTPFASAICLATMGCWTG
jgi:hypothetical protein